MNKKLLLSCKNNICIHIFLLLFILTIVILNLMKKRHNTRNYESRNYRFFFKETQMGRNWHLIIYTNFKTLEEFPSFYIIKWASLIKSEEISFIMYRFSTPFDTDLGIDSLCIICYVELKKNSRARKLKNFFGFANNIVSANLACGSSKGSINFFIIESKNKGHINNLFWLGKPRLEKSIANSSNFSFIIENNLFKKAQFNCSFPNEFLKVLEKDQDNLNFLQKKKEVKHLDQLNSDTDKVNFVNMLKVNKQLTGITINFVHSCADLIKQGTKGLKIRNLFFDYLAELIKFEINNAKQNQSSLCESFVFNIKDSKHIFFNWINIEVIFRYFIEETLQAEIDDIQLYNVISTTEISDISVSKESFKKRLRENKRLKELKKIFYKELSQI